MTEFIVLGTIPGTNIQIDFLIWLQVTAIISITFFALSKWLKRSHAKYVEASESKQTHLSA